MNKKITLIIIAIILFNLHILLVSAQTTIPEAPETFEIESRSRRDPSLIDNVFVNAVAGNITGLSIDGKTSTQSWFGVYGNITGTLVLSNGANRVMYDWSVANPRGEIFATKAPGKSPPEQIVWNDLACFDYSREDYEDYYTLDDLHNDLGIDGAVDSDAVNRTFLNINPHAEFYVGTRHFPANSCPATSMYNSSQEQDLSRFQQVLLYNDRSGASGNFSIVYTSIIEYEDVRGFNNEFMDFQMLLGVDGHRGVTTPVTYYFYVELE